jgi:hypothetical protein
MSNEFMTATVWASAGGLAAVVAARLIIRTYFKEKRASLKQLIQGDTDEHNQQEKE